MALMIDDTIRAYGLLNSGHMVYIGILVFQVPGIETTDTPSLIIIRYISAALQFDKYG